MKKITRTSTCYLLNEQDIKEAIWDRFGNGGPMPEINIEVDYESTPIKPNVISLSAQFTITSENEKGCRATDPRNGW